MLRPPRSPVVADLLLGVALCAIASLEVAQLDPAKIEGNVIGLHIADLLLIPAVALRRRAPLTSILVAALGFAVLSALVSAPVATPFLALLFLLGSLGWNASTRTGVVGVGITLLAGMTWDLFADDFSLADLLVNAVLLTLAWAGAHLLRRSTDRRVAAEVEADRAAREAAAHERERISRDLHDSLAHALTLITLQAGSARERADPSLATATLEGIERTGREAIADLHRFLDLLGPREEEAPGLAYVETMVEGVRRGGTEVTLELTTGGLPPSIETTVFRVIQEGLTNAVRHSHARRIHIAVEQDARGVVATVSSEGLPRTPDLPSSGRGLTGLRQRLHLFAGELHAGPTATGWDLSARIPLEIDPCES